MVHTELIGKLLHLGPERPENTRKQLIARNFLRTQNPRATTPLSTLERVAIATAEFMVAEPTPISEYTLPPGDANGDCALPPKPLYDSLHSVAAEWPRHRDLTGGSMA